MLILSSGYGATVLEDDFPSIYVEVSADDDSCIKISKNMKAGEHKII